LQIADLLGEQTNFELILDPIPLRGASSSTAAPKKKKKRNAPNSWELSRLQILRCDDDVMTRVVSFSFLLLLFNHFLSFF
jgi:hypothetical protein